MALLCGAFAATAVRYRQRAARCAGGRAV